MAGGSFLDIAALYCCGYSYTNEIFHSDLDKWICNDDVIKFEGLDYIDNVPLMLKMPGRFRKQVVMMGFLVVLLGRLMVGLSKFVAPRNPTWLGI